MKNAQLVKIRTALRCYPSFFSTFHSDFLVSLVDETLPTCYM